ncbi:MAG: hypothetical protein HY860_07125 [Chlamydiales bacterium]|nr:hypothetical protein [Chlamydiales bacterium]
MSDAKKFKLRQKRLFANKTDGLHNLLISIMEIMEKQYARQGLRIHLQLEEKLPATIHIEEQTLCYLFFYIIEAFLFDIGKATTLRVVVSSQTIRDVPHIYFILMEENRYKSEAVFFKLLQAVERIIKDKAADSFSFELASDLIHQLGGEIWMEHEDQPSPVVHFILKC